MSPDRRKPKSQSPPLPSYDEAAELVAAYAARLVRLRPGVERVRLDQALGRVLAEPLRADADQPPFARSTRDGFACRAAEASTHRPPPSPARPAPGNLRPVRFPAAQLGRL